MKKILLITGLLFVSVVSLEAQTPDFHFNGVVTEFSNYMTVTTVEKNALTFTASDRVIVYDSDTDQFEYWDGDSWETLIPAGSGNIYSTNGTTTNRTVTLTDDNTITFQTEGGTDYFRLVNSANVTDFEFVGNNFRLDTGAGFDGILDMDNATADRTYTYPDRDLLVGEDRVFEKELTDAENNINVGFNLHATTVVYLNGKVVPNSRWSGEGTTTLNLSLDTKQYDNLTVKN